MMSRTLASAGAHKVYIVGRRLDKLEEAAAACPTHNIVALPGDVTSRDDLRRISRHVREEAGYINLLVCNAGVSGPRIKALSLDCSLGEFADYCFDTPMEEFTETYNSNCTAAFYTTLAFLELLDAGNKKGNMHPLVKSQVIATSSIAAHSRLRGAGFAYNSSKAATTHLMKLLATYLVPHGIRCNILTPGLFPSDLAEGVLKARDFDPSMIPAGRTGAEEDMAGTILYLASRAGAYCNGNVQLLDGGRLGVLPSTY